MATSMIPGSVAPTVPSQANPEVAQKTTRSLRRGWLWLRRVLFSGLLLGGVGAIAYWGYRSDWRLSELSALLGQRAEAAPDDWCAEHSVPESLCIACDPKLAPTDEDYGWCAEHGVAQCLLDHPEIAQLKAGFQPAPEDLQRAAEGLALRPRVENNALCKLHQKRIQFVSDEALAKSGVDIAVVARRPVTETVVGNGELVYDQTAVAHLSSRAAGTVVYAEKQIGEAVEPGEVLALIDSTEVGRAKANLLESITQHRLADATVERLRPLAADATIPVRQFREAEAALQTAEARLLASHQALVNLGMDVDLNSLADQPTRQIALQLQFMGIPDELLSIVRGQALAGIGLSSNLFALRAPLAGTIVERDVVIGEVVDSNKLLFTMADPARMWLLLNVRQEDVDYVQVGQPVRFHLGDDHRASDPSKDPLAGAGNVEGRVAWINTSADEQTRTVQVRVQIANPRLRLRANTFGTGQIVLRDEPQALVIPSEALHWDGDCNVVFVRDKQWFEEGAPKFFHVRKVRVGVQDAESTEILVGLAPGEVIASKNSVVLEAQLLKSKLGEGCGCTH